MNKLFLRILFLVILISGVNSFAQSLHKGMSFQGVIKLPSGEYPTRSGIAINARILSPNNCILREEQFTGVNISKGYVNLVIGSGAAGSNDPALLMKQVMNNSSIIAGLICLNLDGSVSGNTSYNPTLPGEVGSRKLRISMYIDSIPVVADFNIRAVGYAIDSETLNGRSATEFIQTSTTITQARMEAFFAELLGGSGGAVKWDGSSFTSYDPNNGTNLTNIPSSAITSLDYAKISNVPATLAEIAGLTCTDSQIIKKVAGAWQCSSDSATSVQEFAKNLPSTGLSVNGSNQLEVQYGTVAGTAAQGNDSRIVGAFQASSSLAGDVSGTPGATKVDRIQNRPVDPGIETDGILVWSGASWIPRQMPECAANQTVSWSSTTDTFTCAPISIWQTQVSGTVPVTKGGTGVTALPANSILLGNADGSALSGLTCTDDQVLKKSGGAWTCVNDDSLATETDPTVQAYSKNAPGTGLSVNGSNQLEVQYGTSATTAAAGNDARITGAFPTSTTLSGDLTGTLPSPNVVKIQNHLVSSAAPGGLFTWDSATTSWIGQAPPICTATQNLRWGSVLDRFSCVDTSVLAANISGNIPVTKGGTGMTAIPANSVIVGNAGGSALEGLACADGQLLQKVSGVWSCVNSNAITSETDPTVQAFSKNAPTSGITVNGSNQLAVNTGTGLSVNGSNQLEVQYGTSATTAAAGNDSRITGAFAAATSLGGDLSGTLPNPLVAQIQGHPVDAAVTADGVMVWDGTKWVAKAMPECTASQKIKFTAATDTFSCENITVAVADITGTLPVSKGGTGLATLPAESVLIGNGTSAVASLSCADGQLLQKVSGVWSCVNSNAITSETDPTVQAYSKNAPGTGLSVNGSNQLEVQYGTSATTAAVGNDSRITGAFQATTTLSGDLTGTLPSPNVVKIQNHLVSSAAPGGLFTWDSATTSWIGQAPPICTATQNLRWGSVLDRFSCVDTSVLAANISGNIPVTKGGTGMTAIPANSVIVGNAGGSALEGLACADGQLLQKVSGVWSCVNSNAITSETDPTVQAYSKNAPGTGLSVNGSNQLEVQYGTSATTAAAGNDSRITGAFATATSLGGDLSGTLPNPLVAQIQGHPVDAAVTADGVMVWDGAKWVAKAMPECTASQKIKFTAATDTFSCENISVPVADITGTLPVSKGGTGLATLPANSVLIGNGTSAVASLACADGQLLQKIAGVWSCVNSNAITSETDPTVQAFSKNVPTSGITVNGSNQLAVNAGTGLSVNGSNQLEVQYGTSATTAAAGNDSRITGAFQATTTLSGDLTGTLPSPNVVKIQNRSVSSAAPGGLFTWDSATTSWIGQAPPICTATQNLRWGSVLDRFSCVDTSVLAANISGNIPVTKGGTGMTAIPANSVIVGNAGGSALEGLACADGQLLQKVSGVWSCVNSNAITSETDPTVQAYSKNAPTSGITVNGSNQLVANTGTGLAVNGSNQIVVQYGTSATTAAAGNDSRITGAFATATSLGGDLSGTLPNPLVAQIQGHPVDAAVTADGVMVWDGTKWIAKAMPECTASQKIKFTAATDTFSCENITVAVADITGTLPVSKGGTGLATLPANSVLIGNGTSAVASLACADGQLLQKIAGVWSCVNSNAITSETDPTVQAYSKNAPGTGLSVNGSNQLEVQYGTSATTAAAGNDSRITGAFATATSLSGDLSGTLPSPNVVKIQNRSVSSAAPGGLFTWDSATTSWIGQAPPICTATQNLRWGSVLDRFSCVDTSVLAANISGNIPVTKGGTGMTAIPANSVIVGNAGGSALEGLACADGQLLQKIAGVWSCVNSNSITSETDPTVQAFSKNAPTSGITVNGSNQLVANTGTGLAVNGSNQIVVQYGTSATTAAAGNDSRITGAFATATSLGGDLSGTLPNPLVAQIQGHPVDAAVTADGVMVWDGAKWVAKAMPECTASQKIKFTAATDTFSCENISVPVADITGTLPVSKGGTGLATLPANSVLIGNGTSAVASLACVDGQLLKKAGGAWVCVNSNAAVTETDPNVQAFAKQVLGSGLAVNGSNNLMISTDSTLSFTGLSQLKVNYGTSATTAAAGNDTRITGAFQAATALGGDLSGTLPNPTVTQIQGRAVASAAPTDGVLTWNSTLNRWEAVIPTICGANQTMQWNSTSDNFLCVNATVTAANVSGTMAVSQGGTGLTAIPAKAVLVGNTGGTGITSVAPGAADTVLGISGGDWASVPAGRTSCPAGYVLIGPSGDRSSFCISQNKSAAKALLPAAYQGCASLTGSVARLCTTAEWERACVDRVAAGIVGMGTGADNGKEWIDGGSFVDASYNEGGWALGYNSPSFTCFKKDANWAVDSYHYRCCIH